MAAKVFQTGLLTDSGAGDIGWSRVPLGALHGDKGATALRQAGVEVHLADAVTAVRPGGRGPGRRALAAAASSSAPPTVSWPPTAWSSPCPITAPRKCCPRRSARRTYDPSQLGSSPIVNVHVHFDRRVTDLRLAAALGTPRAVDLRPHRLLRAPARASTWPCPSPAPTTTSAPAPRTSDGEMVEALAALFPAAREAKVLKTFVTREHNATFRASPGSSRTGPPARTLVPGLAVAGAWTATGWPPTMEGAVRSGLAAARDRPAAARATHRRLCPRASFRAPCLQAHSGTAPGGHVTPTTSVVEVLERARDLTQPLMRDAVGGSLPASPRW